jgi:hypothetical protein
VLSKSQILAIFVVDRPRFDSDPDQDSNFHVGADPDPDWHQNNADQYRQKLCGSDPIPIRIHNNGFFSHSFAHDTQSFVTGSTRPGYVGSKTEQIYVQLKTNLGWGGGGAFYISFCTSMKDIVAPKTPPVNIHFLFSRSHIHEQGTSIVHSIIIILYLEVVTADDLHQFALRDGQKLLPI